MLFAELKHCWYDLWAPHPWGQVLNPLHPLRVQSHKRHVLFKSCHPCSPWRKFGFPRMHHLLITLMQTQRKQWISIAMNLISIILSLVWSWSNLGRILRQTFTKDHEHFILEGPVEFLWNLNWSPVSILLICKACKLEASFLSQHIRVSMSEMNLISSRCHRSLLSVKKDTNRYLNKYFQVRVLLHCMGRVMGVFCCTPELSDGCSVYLAALLCTEVLIKVINSIIQSMQPHRQYC